MGNCNFKSEYDNDNVVGRSLLSLPCSLHFLPPHHKLRSSLTFLIHSYSCYKEQFSVLIRCGKGRIW